MREPNGKALRAQARVAVAAEGTGIGEKLPFTEPKLTFVEPKLVKQGGLEEITAGFFGTFSP